VETRLAQELVQVVRESFKNQAEMAAEHEMPLQFHDMEFLEGFIIDSVFTKIWEDSMYILE
jgi:hypothetical protein